MSEVKLNLIDSQRIIQGTIHGSIVDACVAALSAEPETIAELESALTRYIGQAPEPPNAKSSTANHRSLFSSFRSGSEIDSQPWDAGLVIIDLTARVAAAESTYSQPQAQGKVRYHNGTVGTDIPVMYRVPDDWIFLNAISDYEAQRFARTRERSAKIPLDARSVLYGPGLLEFIAMSVRQSPICQEEIRKPAPVLVDKSCIEQANAGSDGVDADALPADAEEAAGRALYDEISSIHARWLMTSRDDLHGQSPRDVLLAKQDFIDFDLHTRSLQWSLQGEGPPCLATNSFAYRFAGFGTHECVLYYDLVRHLLWSELDRLQETSEFSELEAEIGYLEAKKTAWLETPQEDGGRIPAIIIDNERRRLPTTLQAQEMIIDEDCELCVWSANEVAMGHGPAFWHLDGCNMDDGFAFSFCRTREEWDEENRRREEFDREFNLKWEERQKRIARGEEVEDEFGEEWLNSPDSELADSQPSDREDESNLIQ
ncbi:MAG: hypothetical protein AABM67_12080 [Acidobacteriota bacterium]